MEKEDIHLVLETEKVSIRSVHMTYRTIIPLHLYTDWQLIIQETGMAKENLNYPDDVRISLVRKSLVHSMNRTADNDS